MTKQFSYRYLAQNKGCYTNKQLGNLSFIKKEVISLNDILESEISLKDKYWFVCKKLFTTDQNKKIAIAVAELVLPIFEKKFPADTRPKKAIDAAKNSYAAAYSAAAAHSAAAHSAAAADNNGIKNRLLNYLIEFCNE